MSDEKMGRGEYPWLRPGRPSSKKPIRLWPYVLVILAIPLVWNYYKVSTGFCLDDWSHHEDEVLIERAIEQMVTNHLRYRYTNEYRYSDVQSFLDANPNCCQIIRGSGYWPDGHSYQYFAGRTVYYIDMTYRIETTETDTNFSNSNVFVNQCGEVLDIYGRDLNFVHQRYLSPSTMEQ